MLHGGGVEHRRAAPSSLVLVASVLYMIAVFSTRLSVSRILSNSVLNLAGNLLFEGELKLNVAPRCLYNSDTESGFAYCSRSIVLLLLH